MQMNKYRKQLKGHAHNDFPCHLASLWMRKLREDNLMKYVMPPALPQYMVYSTGHDYGIDIMFKDFVKGKVIRDDDMFVDIPMDKAELKGHRQ